MKRWLEPFATAWTGVATHKLRSFLTTLGIVIGVAAVIALMSLGRGAEADILSRVEALGSDLIFVRPGATFAPGGVRGAIGGASTLTLEDARAISQQVSDLVSVAPSASRSLQVVFGSQNMNTQVIGVTPEYAQAFNLNLTSGNFFSEYDYQRGARIAVLGSDVEETLFDGVDPIGQMIRMGNNVVRVVGVLESKGTSMMGLSDEAILVPLTALQQMVARTRTAQGERVVSSIAVKVAERELSSGVVADITSLLRSRHRLSADAADDFSITSIEELASTISETIGTMTLLLGAIAAISLLVGGIGVMNIMLVSVLERTREIGIRKALGAKERDIWGQFLIEAALLSLAGGVIGVILGWTIATFVNRMGVMTTVVSADIVVLAVSVSVGIGLFFGFYPAWNASRLDPIEALRSE